jgi:GDP-D-mannose 3',5'-epimerase
MNSMTKSDFSEPLNLGSDEMVSMNEMAEMILGFSDKKLPIKHIPGPEGVRGRNSDNTLIKEKLGWAPVRIPTIGGHLTELIIVHTARNRNPGRAHSHAMAWWCSHVSCLICPPPT